MADKLTTIQQHALDWCRARESFLHTEFRRAGITGPTIYSLIKRGLVTFDTPTCRYRTTVSDGVMGTSTEQKGGA